MVRFYAPTKPEITPGETARMELSRKLAGECVVLLKNEGILPLDGKGKIALFGNGARKTIKGGTGSGDVNSRTVINIEQGLKEAGFEITTGGWLDRYDSKWESVTAGHRDQIMREAEEKGIPPVVAEFDNPLKGIAPVAITQEDIQQSQTETAVYVIARNSGEGADRFFEKGDYLLSDEEESNLSLLVKHYKKVVVVLNIGGVMDLSAVSRMPGIGAIVHMAQLGNIGGYVLADVLLGNITPSGKLTDTWAKDYYDYPSSKGFSHNNGDVSDEYYTDGIYVGYRYFDTFNIEPEYCFGYGISYTDFSIDTKKVTVQNAIVSVQTDVCNIGDKYSGKEVVQVYVSAPEGKLDKPYQELAAFEKTRELKPGESQLLEITFAVAELASYSEAEASWVLEAGDYVIRVGNSSRNTVPAGIIRIEDTVRTEEVRNVFALDCNLEEIKAPARTVEIPDVPVILMDSSSVRTRKAVYQEKRKQMDADSGKAWSMSDVKDGRCTVEQLAAQCG